MEFGLLGVDCSGVEKAGVARSIAPGVSSNGDSGLVGPDLHSESASTTLPSEQQKY